MNDFNSERLIHQLSKELKPVDQIWSPEKRTLVFTFINILLITGFMSLVAPFRESLKKDIVYLPYLIECLLFLMTLFLTNYFFFLSLIPGGIKSRTLRVASMATPLLLLFFTYRLFTTNLPIDPSIHRPYCDIEVFVLALAPLVQYFYLIKKDYFSHGKWTFLYASLGASLTPAFIMHFMCQQNYQHILFFHFMPVFIIALIAFFFFERKFK